MDLFDGLDAYFLDVLKEKELATVTAKGGAPRQVRIMWEQVLMETDPAGGVAVAGKASSAHLSARDAEGITGGARLSYQGKAYTVEDANPDCGGMVALRLKRAAG
ncbi:hypothetical protein WDZ11_00120 (plasmid) [Roseomonas mucosa]|uniref:head-tail joining protein n=1 Tax=Roseomonas mucosa TaxID=207340 RepID=UPI0030CBE0D9